MKRMTSFLAGSAAAVLLGAFSLRADGQERKTQPAPDTSSGVVAKVPRTPEEHLALADRYTRKAVEYRAEAKEHRQMLVDYQQETSMPPNKSGRELPWVAKMRNHCEGYVNKAEELAGEAERFAEFHRMRAKELQGQ